MHSSKKINDGWLWWYLSQRMPTQLNGGKVKHLPSLELTSFAAIATYQLAFCVPEKEDSTLHINSVMHDEIYLQVLYISQISSTSTKR